MTVILKKVMLYYNKTTEQSLKNLKSSASGLTSDEVAKRLREYGPNSLQIKGQPLWRKIVEPFLDVFMIVLVAAGAISLFSGSALDAIIIWAIVVINAITHYIQKYSSERILKSLRKHNQQAADVLRDGEISQIDAANLVPGDIVELTEGDRIPADGRLLVGSNLRINESMLTGESEPVDKDIEPLSGEKEVYERRNTLFQGSFVVGGDAKLLITATGNDTEFGQLAALSTQTDTRSPIQTKIDKLVRQIVTAVAVLSVAAFFLAMRNGMELADSLNFVMALAVSAVPEGLPIAISVILVLGVSRMAKRNALMRSMRAIETLGVVTTIATDKTGTLTRNQLSVQELWSQGDKKGSLERAMRRSAISTGDIVHDPLDIAIINYSDLDPTEEPVETMPFSQAVSMSGNIFRPKQGLTLYLKGAPEAIIGRSDMTENETELAMLQLNKLTSQGYRVVAVAKINLKKSIEDFSQLDSKARFEFSGLIGIADSIRPEAKKVIRKAEAAGISVRMITGDHLETAYSIGRKLGMATNRSQVLDSRSIASMTDTELASIVSKTKIFARVTPSDKFRLLQILKQQHITAMTGDGVNDVPALSSAHVGITMGDGTEIAKDSGDMILLDNNFKNIIDAIAEGRVIVDNIRRMLFYLLSTNTGEALTMLVALLLGIPAPLLPVQILWINLVTDTSMVIPLGLEPGEDDVMKRKPEKPGAPIMSRTSIIRMLSVATTMTVVAISMYLIFDPIYGHEYARTIVFTSLVVMQWANAFNARSDHESVFTRVRARSNKFYVGLVVSIILQLLVIFGPLKDLMHVTDVNLQDLLSSATVSFIFIIAVDEIYKIIIRSKNKSLKQKTARPGTALENSN